MVDAAQVLVFDVIWMVIRDGGKSSGVGLQNQTSLEFIARTRQIQRHYITYSPNH